MNFLNVFYEGIRLALEKIYGICGDYGIAIVLVTLLIRFLMLPFGRKQRKAAKKQQEVSLKAEEINRKYKNDTCKKNAELQKLYQREGMGNFGCLFLLLQFPVMIILYQGIRLAAAVNATTILLPWVPSLLERDSSCILPLLTVFVQIFPMLLPYIGFFKSLHLQKMSLPMIFSMLFMNGWFAFLLPAGIGLYYMVSGVFTLAEQMIRYILELRRFRVA